MSILIRLPALWLTTAFCRSECRPAAEEWCEGVLTKSLVGRIVRNQNKGHPIRVAFLILNLLNLLLRSTHLRPSSLGRSRNRCLGRSTHFPAHLLLGFDSSNRFDLACIDLGPAQFLGSPDLGFVRWAHFSFHRFGQFWCASRYVGFTANIDYTGKFCFQTSDLFLEIRGMA